MFGTQSAHLVNRSLGIRAEEGGTVRLFFWHNFLLGIGTMLVYVAATVILLENNPETSLPVAYLASAAGMIAVGRLYAYFEHSLPLPSLVGRVLWSVIVLVGIVLILVAFGHSVGAAIAIMVGFRVIYLLTNLEFWALSALVFDVRQSKRLFGVISAGDMPAKALGALLAALIHHHSDLLPLLLVAFGFYGAALYTASLTLRRHKLHATHQPARPTRRPTGRLVQQFFGGSGLISAVCLNLIPVAVVAAGIEYEFFINVKHRYHAQADVMQYLGYVLALTYLLAMVVKLLASRRTVEKLGIQPTLRLLPGAALLGLLAYAFVRLPSAVPTDTVLLIYFCGLYLVFEVVRRALFDSVLLVLFQPLPPAQRLKGHTLAKGLYEPLGMGLAGGLLLALPRASAYADTWLLGGIGLFSVLMLVFIGRTYRQYVQTLQDALGRRFVAADDLAVSGEVATFIDRALDSPRPDDILSALDFLGRQQATTVLPTRADALLGHADARVRLRTLQRADELEQPLPGSWLERLVRDDGDVAVRTQAAEQLARQDTRPISPVNNRLDKAEARTTARMLLASSDLPARQGAIIGYLKTNPTDAPALSSLADLIRTTHQPERQQTALACIGALRLPGYAPFIDNSLTSEQPDLVRAALDVAATAPEPGLLARLVQLLPHKTYGGAAVRALAAAGDPAIAALPTQPDSALLFRRAVAVAGRIRTTTARTYLLRLLGQAPLTQRLPILNALRDYPATSVDDPLYAELMADEVAFARRLLYGQAEEPEPVLHDSLTYEMSLVSERLLLLLMGLYDRETVSNVRQSLTHATAERRANSLELLENLIPKPVYACLQALTDELPLPDRLRLLNEPEKTTAPPGDIRTYIQQQGHARFTDWTIRVAPGLPHDDTSTANLTMHHHAETPTATALIERVFLLKNSTLFANTPANVLATIAPIMREVTYQAGQAIVRKGELGTCMFLIQEGEVRIEDGPQQLAQFSQGDVFGELALLDTEPRSASAIAQTDVTLFRLDQDDFYDLMEERDEVMRNIIRMLCARIRLLNQKVK